MAFILDYVDTLVAKAGGDEDKLVELIDELRETVDEEEGFFLTLQMVAVTHMEVDRLCE